jgi:hypothetical protein
MDHVCAGRQLRLSFVRDPHVIAAIIHRGGAEPAPHETLASLALAWAVRRQPQDVNHIVLAATRPTGQHRGFLVAHDGATGLEPFLLLDVSLTATPQEADVVLRRMLGLAVLRMVGFGQSPGVLVARTRQPALCQALRDLARHVPAAAFHPDPASNIVPLATATLAQRVARAAGEPGRFLGNAGLAVLDLRAAPEPALIDGARWLYRARRTRRR